MRRVAAVILLILVFSGAAFAKETQLEKATNVLNEIMEHSRQRHTS